MMEAPTLIVEEARRQETELAHRVLRPGYINVYLYLPNGERHAIQASRKSYAQWRQLLDPLLEYARRGAGIVLVALALTACASPPTTVPEIQETICPPAPPAGSCPAWIPWGGGELKALLEAVSQNEDGHARCAALAAAWAAAWRGCAHADGGSP